MIAKNGGFFQNAGVISLGIPKPASTGNNNDKNDNDSRHAAMEVQVCPKSDAYDGCFDTMRASSRPIDLDQWTETAVWNSLCDLGDDQILAVSQYNGYVYIVRGKIILKE